MSYEGFERVLCAKGHLHEWNVYCAPSSSSLGLGEVDPWEDPNVEPWTCHCGSPAVWWEGVDQTNDSGVQTKLVEYEPEQTSTCEHCGASKVDGPPRYCVPVANVDGRGRINPGIELQVPTSDAETERLGI